jgi:hypothetical protein
MVKKHILSILAMGLACLALGACTSNDLVGRINAASASGQDIAVATANAVCANYDYVYSVYLVAAPSSAALTRAQPKVSAWKAVLDTDCPIFLANPKFSPATIVQEIVAGAAAFSAAENAAKAVNTGVPIATVVVAVPPTKL